MQKKPFRTGKKPAFENSDGSVSKFFDPGQIGSIFCGLGRVGSAIYGLGLNLKIFP